MIKLLAIVKLKDNVTDNHGNEILLRLKNSDFNNVNNIKYGKLFTITLDEDDSAKAKQIVEKMCETLLANSYIEEYEVKII